MSMSQIGAWLLSRPGFLNLLDRLTIDSAIGELGPSFVRAQPAPAHDWGYLLLAASALAQAEGGECQAAALRIAQSALQSGVVSDSERRSAALVLDSLSNQQAINLAVGRDLLTKSYAIDLPFPALAEMRGRELSSTITLGVGNRTTRVNRFQRRLWRELEASSAVSISAPTSAGKSYILAHWIGRVVASSPEVVVVYLVPTRALISQVEADLKRVVAADELKGVHVSSMPLLQSKAVRRILVLTQERLQMLLSNSAVVIDALFVDEAQKVGDGARGLLLQQLIERVVDENPDVRIAFASPMTSNPEVLISDLGSREDRSAFVSEDVTVSQNLFWLTQRPGKPKQWNVELCLRGMRHEIGELTLAASPNRDGMRLPLVAFAVGRSSVGNIVYVNGPAEAEKTAIVLAGLIGENAELTDEQIGELVDLSRKVVHPEFQLSYVLRRGVAFHYGNMPLLLKTEIERLFSAGIIRFLVCTSTLLEGVNLACRNVFVRGPQKGLGNLMTAEDFWNLAGRAGRWGMEFQGNVFCVDPRRAKLWAGGSPPSVRIRKPIVRFADEMLKRADHIVEYAQSRGEMELEDKASFDSVLSYLSSVHVLRGGLANAPWRDRVAVDMPVLSKSVDELVDGLGLPSDVIVRNPGIGPFSIKALLDDLNAHSGGADALMPVEPASDDAVDVFAGIFRRLAKTVAPKLGPDSRSFMLSLLVVKWMRGIPLSRLIGDRLNYVSSRGGDEVRVAAEIRSVMADVEQIARFEAPRALSCYQDVLKVHLQAKGRPDLVSRLPELGILLEFGVSVKTQISLISIGLSRTATIMLSEFIAADSLTEDEVVAWLLKNTHVWRTSELPALVRREIGDVLAARSSTDAE